jgi:hypothetical protein
MAAAAEAFKCVICKNPRDYILIKKSYEAPSGYVVAGAARLDLGPQTVMLHVGVSNLSEEDHTAHRLCLLALQKECAKNFWPRICPFCSKHFVPFPSKEEVPSEIFGLIEPALKTIQAALLIGKK